MREILDLYGMGLPQTLDVSKFVRQSAFSTLRKDLP